MEHGITNGLYGRLPDGIEAAPADARQFSPLVPGAARLEDVPAGTLENLAILAPPGTIERRAVLASGLKALAEGGALVALAPKAKGGARLADELRAFGCTVEESAKRHHRVCTVRRPARPEGIEAAVEAGAPRLVEALGLWSQPGVFSWDRLDPGSALLIEHLPRLSGRGADLGCGIGVLGHAVLASPNVKGLAALDLDRRALEAARRNLDDPRVSFRWIDLAAAPTGLDRLDFVVMNPPFHEGGGAEDKALGQTFVRRAAESLRPGGTLVLTANRHLPYEAALGAAFKAVTPLAERGGFKVIEARK